MTARTPRPRYVRDGIVLGAAVGLFGMTFGVLATTAGLDVASEMGMWELLEREARSGRGVLLTTHNMPEVEAICDRVAILCKGRLVALDSPMNLRRQHAERKVDVVLTGGERLVFDMDDQEEAVRLSRHLVACQVASIQSREFDFHEAFLKLTGTAFD